MAIRAGERRRHDGQAEPRPREGQKRDGARRFLGDVRGHARGGEKTADCDRLQDGTYGAVVMTDLARQSADMNAIIKFLLQSGQPAGTSKTYIYTLEKATTKADLKPDTCWDLKALQAEAAAAAAAK